jgi:hypothetical protein
MTIHRNIPMMRTATRSALLMAALVATAGLQAQNNIAVNNTGAAADPSAILDVNTTFTGAATRGMLIPRVANVSAVTVNAGTDGMLVYQTGAPAGFYYYNSTIPAWVPIQTGKDGWEIYGNVIPAANVAAEWFGTTDNQDVVFRTNNVERMRLDNQGELGIGVGAPSERLDVGGALRLHSTAPRTIVGAPASPPGSNLIYSATDGLGVIEYQRDTVRNALASWNGTFWSGRRLMYPGHYGNMTGTGVTASGATPNSGGWTRMNNDYIEVFNAPYSINGDATCGAGFSEIPSPALPLVPANLSSSLPAIDQPRVDPYMHNFTGSRRFRMQFMFLRNELNAELNQQIGINGVPSTTATAGLCPGQPVNTLAFWINQAVVPANQKNWTYAITIKHAPAGLNNLSGGYDNTVDPAAGCATGANQPRPNLMGAAGWDVFNLTTPFTWDGVRNVIVEVAMNYAPNANNIAIPIKVYQVPGAAPANQLTYTSYGNLPLINPLCNSLGTAATCSATIQGAGMPSALCGTFGSFNYRPVIRWGGTVTTITPFVNSTGPYLQYAGGFIAEDPATTPPWGWQQTPFYAFKGPGTISAQNGVYDNGVRLNDHVFDRAFDGKVRPEDADVFGDRRNLGIDEMADFIATNRHLPTIKGRSDWNKEGSFSLGDMANQLWTTTETQTLYITELHDRLNVAEMLVGTRPLSASEFELAKGEVARMADLTESQKAALVNDLRGRVNPQTNR